MSENLKVDRDITELIINKIKEKTMRKSIKINEEETSNLSIFDSKFGGLPYWDENMEYPTDKNGDALILLAQINFEKTPIKDERFPKEGILQFFIGTNDLMGADFDNMTAQNGFRVVYHEDINTSVTKEQIRAQGIRANTELDGASEEYFPFYKQYEITFEESMEPISTASNNFEEILKQSAEEVLKCDIEDVWSIFESDEEDLINDTFYICGHKILGYPFFTQWDPREDDEMYKNKKYDTLLLQIDSVGDILWGDSGVGNFFINEEDLKNKNFNNVMYTWDCY
ncbi:MAG: YwqG family protein [Methanosphaera sp.]|nr:YwqG family protein [Methanosphaera sp.]